MAKNAEQAGFLLFQDLAPIAAMLDDCQRGRLLTALFAYAADGTRLESGDQALDMAFTVFRGSIDRASANWKRLRAQRAEAGRKGGLAKARSAEKTPEPFVEAPVTADAEAEAFAEGEPEAVSAAPALPEAGTEAPEAAPAWAVPYRSPSMELLMAGANANAPDAPRDLEEVRRFCRSRGLERDPLAFYSYYAVRGWRVDGEPVRDWRGLLLRWFERRDALEPNRSG